MPMLNLIDQAFALRLTIALLQFLWQGALIALVAAVASWLLRRASANTRYTVHVAALALMSSSAAVTFAWVSIDAPAPTPVYSKASHQAAVANHADEATVAPKFSVGWPNVASTPSTAGGEQLTPPPATSDRERAFETEPVAAEAAQIAHAGAAYHTLLVLSAPYVTVVYLVGVLMLLVRLVRGAWDSRRLRRAATEIADVDLMEWVGEQSQRLGLQIVPAFRRCAEISVPVVIGVLRPVILFPTIAATGLSMDQLRAIIAHELAHVRRYDLVVNLSQRVIETLLFFHPAVWWISRQISREREVACDELVLTSGFERTQYADALVRMAEFSCAQRGHHAPPATALAADGATPTDFKRRILRILGVRESSHVRPGRWALLLAATAAMLAVLLPAALVHLDRTAKAEPAQPAEDNLDRSRESSDAQRSVPDHTTLGNGVTLAISPDGRRLAVMNGNPSRTMYRDGRSVAKDWKPTVEIIDTDTQQVVTSLDLSNLPHDATRPVEQGPTFVEATAMAFAPDAATLAVGTSVGQLLLFNAETGALIKPLDDQEGRQADEKTPDFWKQLPRVMGSVKSIAISADGQQLAVCGESFADWSRSLDRIERGGLSRTAPGRLRVFEVETGKLRFNPAAHSDVAVGVAYSPNGKYLASAGRWMDSLENHQFGDGVILWDAQTGERKAQIDLQLRGWIYDIEFSPDSKRIMIGAQDFDEGGGNGQGVAAMLSAETLTVLWRRPIKRSAMSVAFNPQQTAVIVLTNREDLSYIDAVTGKTEAVLKVADPNPPKKQRCESFAISPQGHLLAIGIVEKGQGLVKYVRIGKLAPDTDKNNWPVKSTGFRFSEPTELVLSMGTLKFMHDLDSGETMDPPATAGRPEQRRMDLHPSQSQPYQIPEAMTGIDLAGINVPPASWNASVTEFREAMDGDRVQPLAKLPLDPKGSATFFFRTRDGASGILQLIAREQVKDAVNEPWGIRVRYKILELLGNKTAPPASGATGPTVTPLDRPVSLSVDSEPLQLVVERLARQAGLTAQFDSDALRQVELDLQQPITTRFNDISLREALTSVIDWETYLGAMHEVRGNRLVLTTLAAWQARTIERLPDWMKPLYSKGLLARLDENEDVTSITVGNIMTDELLAKIARLPELRELEFELTVDLTPQGLDQMGHMPRLAKLTVSIHSEAALQGDNVIRSVVGLRSLRELAIIEAGVTDAGAKLLEDMPQLHSLSLRQEGRLTDEALKSIGKLGELESLSLDSYVGTRQLGRMRFSANGIRELRGLQELRSLHLVGQEVRADALRFPKLESLGLGHAAVDDTVAAKIGELRSLRTLELTYCRIGDVGLRVIASLPELRRLDISSTTITDEGIEHLAGCQHLQHVSLRADGVSDRSLEHIARIKSLTRLDLHGNGTTGFTRPGQNFSAAGLAHLKRLPNLKTLWLTNFQLDGGYAVLKDLQQLRELTMLMCDIKDAELDQLEEALPNTRISHATGGGTWIPKRRRP